MVLVSARPLMLLYICTTVREISQTVSGLLSGHEFHSEIFKGALFLKM